jgi:hypothetical protein
VSDVLADAAAWLAGQLKTNVSELVTYVRGNQSITVSATFASQLLRVSDREGNTKVERPDADFIIAAADINFGAGQVEPAAGDIVQVVYGNVTKQFKLMPMGGGSEPAWRYTDPFQTMVRVHTKKIN